jgi:prepilin-type N-terminal cleavage/methylation domain-containing protein
MSLTPNDSLNPHAARRGLTLVELVVALALLAIVATMTLATLRGQQRFQVGMLGIIDVKRNAHHAVDLLYGSLRSASSSDLYAITDSSIAFRATFAASHICGIDSSHASLTVPSNAIETGLSTFLTMPRAGDSLLIFDLGSSPTPDDDRWTAHTLSANPSGGVCPLRPAGLAMSIGAAQGIGITIIPPLGPTVFVGSPLRFFRPTGYSLYRATGGEWMLGHSTCTAGACSARQPLSGPYLPFAGGRAGGLSFEYFDARGSPTSDPGRVARIDVVARARSTSLIDAAHLRAQHYDDSATVTIALRNAS